MPAQAGPTGWPGTDNNGRDLRACFTEPVRWEIRARVRIFQALPGGEPSTVHACASARNWAPGPVWVGELWGWRGPAERQNCAETAGLISRAHCGSRKNS